MSSHRETASFLICGGGIVGLTIARELLRRGADDIVILEKELAAGIHASGRNSGVLHAGIYYSEDSLKAKVCLRGNLMMKEFCRKNALPLLECGKVIVARSENEVSTLKALYERAQKNGAKVELMDERQLAEVEPEARTAGVALYSHYTAVVDPKAVMKALSGELSSTGKVRLLTGVKFTGLEGSATALTTAGPIRFDTFINAAGAHSDRIAHAFSVGLQYRLIPFKGIYRKLAPRLKDMVRGNIYPVPDIRNPFLGVHFTKSIDGEVYLGPTAIPALGRENYGILSGMDAEAPEILCRDAVLFASNPKFRQVALTEPEKYCPKFFYEDAKTLVKSLRPEDIVPSGKSGIRPQLVDWKTKELVMDFIILRDGKNIHVLNAVSPAFTASMAFAKLAVEALH